MFLIILFWYRINDTISAAKCITRTILTWQVRNNIKYLYIIQIKFIIFNLILNTILLKVFIICFILIKLISVFIKHWYMTI